MKTIPYPEYRLSYDGVEQVPCHWKTFRLKNIIAEKITDGPHTTPEFLPEGIPFISVDGIQDGELVFNNCRYISQQNHMEYKKKAFPIQGDLLMGKAASTGKIARVKVDFEFSIWSPLALLKINKKKANASFIEYLLKSPKIQAQIDILCTHNTQSNISMDDIPLLQFEMPTNDEQDYVVSFLDKKIAPIDNLIAKKQRQIELLQEKRSALISHVVTKGLDPSVKMKDSGVEWLGEIPEDWKSVPLKYLCSLLKDGTHLPPPRINIGYPLLSVRNIVEGKLVNLPDDSMISEEDFQILNKSYKVTQNDILLAIVGATIGKVAIVKIMEPFTIQRSLAILRPKPKLLSYGFLAYFLQSSHFQSMLWSTTGYSAQPGIYLEALSNFKIFLPRIGEQNEIVEFLENSNGKIDQIIMKIRQSIKHLEEYRAALISAAVTGKIDLREESTL